MTSEFGLESAMNYTAIELILWTLAVFVVTGLLWSAWQILMALGRKRRDTDDD